MKPLRIALAFLIAIAALPVLADDSIRFAAVDVLLDTEEPVAAWQFELSDQHGVMQVVGVEQGDSGAFARPPYYDREAVRLGRADRIVVADFSLADEADLPVGRVRIATIHLMMSGDDADLDLQLITATTGDGRVIDASVSLASRTGCEQ
jgi:hypothetical protein